MISFPTSLLKTKSTRKCAMSIQLFFFGSSDRGTKLPATEKQYVNQDETIKIRIVVKDRFCTEPVCYM